MALTRGDDPESVEDRIAGCRERPACLRTVYDEAVERGDVVRVLHALDRRGGDCHLEAHRLAHAVYADVGNVERTFLLGGPQCRFGYLHGAVEATGASTVPRCGHFRNPVQQRACAHGFGHALMLRTRNDLRRSVAGCRAAARSNALSEPSCLAGVMMQNSLRYSGRKGFSTASAQGCAAVAESDSLARLCFDNVGIVAALSVDHDIGRAVTLCQGLPRPDQETLCMMGAKGEIAEASR